MTLKLTDTYINSFMEKEQTGIFLNQMPARTQGYVGMPGKLWRSYLRGAF